MNVLGELDEKLITHRKKREKVQELVMEMRAGRKCQSLEVHL